MKKFSLKSTGRRTQILREKFVEVTKLEEARLDADVRIELKLESATDWSSDECAFSSSKNTSILSPGGYTLIVIAVCLGYYQPNNIQALIRALGNEARGVAQEVVITLVANDWAEWEIGELALSLSSSFSIGPAVELIHETRRGIPFARNAALAHAVSLEASWIAFIDDDCQPQPAWLTELHNCAVANDCDAVAGGWEIVADGPTSRLLPRDCFGLKTYQANGIKAEANSRLQTAYTRSVMFDVSKNSLVQQHGLRFDESRVALGGSDVIFFKELTRRGGTIVYCPSSQVKEFYQGERLTLRWWFWRRVRDAQFRLERRELSLRDLYLFLTSVLKILLGVPFVLWALRWRTTSGGEELGRVSLTFAAVWGVIVYKIFRYKSYAVRS